MHIPLGRIEFREGVEFVFPHHMCCNCAAQKDLRVIDQDTRRTTYLVAGGTETTFQLPLPFCERCADSAKRRPKSVVHRLLVLSLAFAGWFTALLLLGELGVLPGALAGLLGPLSAGLALATIVAVVLRARPAAGQSSYFQPVRIPRLDREFVSGAVTGIGFGFTCRDYAKAFRQLNRDAISRRHLFVSMA